MNLDYERKSAIRLWNVMDAELMEHRAYRHPVTMYLLARAKQEAADALLALASVQPNDVDSIRGLQNDVQRFRDLRRWLSEAVDKGRESFQALREEERDQLAAVIQDDADAVAGATYDD